MQSQRVPVVAVALLLAASCGDGGGSPPVADPTTPPSTSTTSEPVVPDTTSAPPVVTTVETPPSDDVMALRPDGLGAVDFGTPAEEAIAELTDVLDAPDRVEPIGPGGECVEGAGWLECVRALRIVVGGQLAVWDSYGLEVALVDTHRDVWPHEQTPLQFGDWHATAVPGDARLVTDGGLYPGLTVGELRAAAPGVEFTYNEGLLDSYSVSFGASGGYWGRLDWIPATTNIEGSDVAAIQEALNDQGADLIADGEWGPNTEAAWLAFLTDHDIEPFSPQLWLTPEIGQQLGLPPDDVIVATLEPRPAAETVAVSLPILRPSGLDRFDFGEPAADVVPELAALLGPPTEDTSYTPDGPGQFEYLPGGFHAAYELRTVTWDAPDFQIVLSDVPYRGDRYDAPTPGVLTLMTWVTTSPRFRLVSGVGVGSTVAELKSRHPDVRFGTYSVCENPYDPASFEWPWLHGVLDWDWISDLQRALNTRGAELAVDGEYGPRTAAALEELQNDLGLDGGNGWIGPESIDALELDEPDSARITLLLGGSQGTC